MSLHEELRQKHYNATVTDLHKVHSDLMILRVRADAGRLEYKPGQFISLGLGYWEPRLENCGQEELKEEQLTRLVKRAYSVSHSLLNTQGQIQSASDLDDLEFYITLVRPNPDRPAATMTPRLFMLEKGMRLNIGGKCTGHYTLDKLKESTKTVIFGATGTGEAPHNAMLGELLVQRPDLRLVSIVCVRHKKDLAYLNMHEQLVKRYPNYTYLSLVTREGQEKLYIQDLFTRDLLQKNYDISLNPETTQVFLCGNPQMLGVPKIDKESLNLKYPTPTGVIEILEQRGFLADKPKIAGNIHYEEYW